MDDVLKLFLFSRNKHTHAHTLPSEAMVKQIAVNDVSSTQHINVAAEVYSLLCVRCLCKVICPFRRVSTNFKSPKNSSSVLCFVVVFSILPLIATKWSAFSQQNYNTRHTTQFTLIVLHSAHQYLDKLRSLCFSAFDNVQSEFSFREYRSRWP